MNIIKAVVSLPCKALIKIQICTPTYKKQAFGYNDTKGPIPEPSQVHTVLWCKSSHSQPKTSRVGVLRWSREGQEDGGQQHPFHKHTKHT